MVTRSRARGGRGMHVEPEMEFRPEVEFLQEMDIPAEIVREVWEPIGVMQITESDRIWPSID